MIFLVTSPTTKHQVHPQKSNGSPSNKKVTSPKNPANSTPLDTRRKMSSGSRSYLSTGDLSSLIASTKELPVTEEARLSPVLSRRSLTASSGSGNNTLATNFLNSSNSNDGVPPVMKVKNFLAARNKLTEFPSALCTHMKGIKHLVLSKNSIKSVPKEISNLRVLQHLDLSHNLIEHLPVELGSIGLTVQFIYLCLFLYAKIYLCCFV